nr:hypothetical protein [Tanacetum cinerariifolium]
MERKKMLGFSRVPLQFPVVILVRFFFFYQPYSAWIEGFAYDWDNLKLLRHVVEPHMVSGFRNIDIELRWKKANHGELPVNNRVLKEVSRKDFQAKPSPATLNKKFDLNQSSKRTVRRGSDPIHNRS